jgi:hypothetical protein
MNSLSASKLGLTVAHLLDELFGPSLKDPDTVSGYRYFLESEGDPSDFDLSLSLSLYIYIYIYIKKVKYFCVSLSRLTSGNKVERSAGTESADSFHEAHSFQLFSTTARNVG